MVKRLTLISYGLIKPLPIREYYAVAGYETAIPVNVKVNVVSIRISKTLSVQVIISRLSPPISSPPHPSGPQQVSML
jgi:hypothetical protein